LATRSIETTDIFRSAFFLCNGGDLCGINIKNNGRRVAVFVIRGEGLDRLDRQYRNGEALVNPVQFRESITHLRDVLFDKLRTYDLSTQRCYDKARKGGKRYDRKRENRINKARR